MPCGDLQQIRLAEMLAFKFDSSGNLIGDPLPLSSAIDLGGGNVVAVSITPCSINLDGATGIVFTFTTAPMNNESFYTVVKAGGASADMTFASTANQYLSVSGFSRFFALAPSINGLPTTGASIVCTIDVIVRV